MTIAEHLSVLYVRCGISEAGLARRLGKSPQSLNSKMKIGFFAIKYMNKMAEALDVTFKRSFVFDNGEEV